ncbi:MAG: RNA-binding S4 domain-containing protein [Burkholderiales bacterium]|nr:RNA-binding S4 domain-containing protein [Burkholderiales bacterium]
MGTRHIFKLDGEFIELYTLLKLLALAPSGGAAKAMIAAGRVSVDGVVETRKARKIRGNQVVRTGAHEVRVVAKGKAGDAAGG